MPARDDRNPDSAPGDWFVDRRCIDCDASREVAPGLVVRRGELSVFARQPETPEEEAAAWRAALVCPTGSVGTVSRRCPPPGLFPQELADGVFRCGYNAMASFGAHAYFAARPGGNFLVDAPRFVTPLVRHLEELGGVDDILLSHRDDVADADRYAEHFGARVWIHEDDADAAPFATHLLRGTDPASIRGDLLAVPVPGHTKGSVVYLLEDRFLFTGDSLAWSRNRRDLIAFRSACWYSWPALKESLGRLAAYSFSWVLAGHGGSVHLPADDLRRRLLALVERM